MNQMYEIGSVGVIVAVFIAACMIILGFIAMPRAVRITTASVALMFVGYQIIEFILLKFIVVAV